MWNAESNDDGKVVVNRATAEREDLDDFEFAKSISASAWGLFGAGLADEVGSMKADRMPAAVKERLAVVATELKEAGEDGPAVKSWKELDEAYGEDLMAEARQCIAHGMTTRQASKFYELPFIAAADLLEDAEIIGRTAMKDIVDRIKAGDASVISEYGEPAKHAASVCKEARSGLCKIAVDQSAADYWVSYYGDYGKDLVSDVKKRVKADVACEWLTKCGVDQAAADYWQNYFTEGGYGKAMTETLPKKISPADSKKKKED